MKQKKIKLAATTLFVYRSANARVGRQDTTPLTINTTTHVFNK